ncbi:hypothetical protein HN011_000411 [Eciton burchellii]|nr:hypothetical protein HN011_000411 [Eciton burchellii]
MSEPQSALLLRKQLAELNKNPVEGFSAGLIDDNDIYRWEVLIIGPPDTLYEGGFFKAHLQFPKEYPLRPPRMKFITEIWHPNIDKNGDVCISILHEPGDDKWGYEKASERWLPVHTVETILISVISMLADPNDESPANVDAAKEWRESYTEFKRKVARCVRKSQEECLEAVSTVRKKPMLSLKLTDNSATKSGISLTHPYAERRRRSVCEREKERRCSIMFIKPQPLTYDPSRRRA